MSYLIEPTDKWSLNLLSNVDQISHLNSEQKIWGEINDKSTETCNINSQIKFKTTMLMSGLCDYRDEYILAKGTITVPNTAAVPPR